MNFFYLITILCLLTLSYNFKNLKKKLQVSRDDCNHHGYFYKNQCFCYSQYEGKHCTYEKKKSSVVHIDQCEQQFERLDRLMSINPDQYQDDDEEFSRLKGNIIGKIHPSYGIKPDGWTKMHDISDSFSIFGRKISYKQIKQGALGNCYFLSAIASLATIREAEIIYDIFETKEDNEMHVYVTRWLLAGKPRYVSVDDWIPGTKDKKPAFAQLFNEEAFWGIIMEKAWAKIHGEYMITQAGNAIMVIEALTQARSHGEILHNKSPEQIYNIIQQAWNNEYAIVGGTFEQIFIQGKSMSSKKLVSRHAYTILKAYEVENDDKSKQKLIQLFNPWNKEKWVDNPWGGQGEMWSDKMKQNYDINPMDGAFHLTPEDFKEEFESIYIGEIENGYEISWVDLPLKESKNEYKVDFIINESSNQYINIFVQQQHMNLLKLKRCSAPFKFVQKSFQVQFPNGLKKRGNPGKPEIKLSQYKSGKYSVELTIEKSEKYLKYITLNAYAPKDIFTFVDENNNPLNSYEQQQQQNDNENINNINNINNIINNNNNNPQIPYELQQLQKQQQNYNENINRNNDKCRGNGKYDIKTGKCQCFNGWKGIDCSTQSSKQCPNDCNGNGQCDSSKGICKCKSGYMEEDCVPCYDKQDCSKYVEIGYCKEGSQLYSLMKKNCQKSCGEAGYDSFVQCYQKQTKSCENVDCNNNRTCIDGECICEKGYQGENCEIKQTKILCIDNLTTQLCTLLASNQECKTKKDSMQKMCAKTCKFC